ncbi:MAG: DNA-protecting protein DprA [Kiritimatiellaeota bacterium]|nr:DNA-protecting protein DprA [Kiritimatiellota bacterium]
MDNREAYIALNLLPGIGPLRVAQLLQFFGDPATILRASKKDLARLPGIGERLGSVIRNWTDHCDLEAELEQVERAGVQIVTREDEAYPELLRQIHDPPLVLYVRGRPETLNCPNSIAIVGTRRPTTYGLRMAEILSIAAVAAGWTVVSGLALGIDTAAHEAVTRHDGRTLAVLGSGLGRVYPQQNLPLARKICDQGALISELPLQAPPDRRNFPMRNRIVSGLSAGTVVVEAGTRSGALITAAQALEQGRQVFAVPGRADSPQARGCHALIKDGARLVESFADVLDEFSGFGAHLRPAPLPKTSPPAERETPGAGLQLSGLERKLLELIAEGEEGIDSLIVRTGEPTASVLGALVMLEIQRLVKQLPGKRVVLRTGEIES